jgi:hypothetical protein
VWAHKIDTKLVAGILLRWICGRTERMGFDVLGRLVDWTGVLVSYEERRQLT